MSQMSNTAVLRCSQCGRPMMLTGLNTTDSDPDSEKLFELMRMIAKNGMCPNCQRVHNYYAQQEQKGIKTDYYVRPTQS